MTVTLKLSEDASEWISEDPQRVSLASDVLQSWVSYERRRASKQSPEARAIVERAKKRVEESANEPVDREELARSLRDDIAAINASQNGQ